MALNLGEAALGPGPRRPVLLGCWPEPAARGCLIVQSLTPSTARSRPEPGVCCSSSSAASAWLELAEGCFTGLAVFVAALALERVDDRGLLAGVG